MIDEILINVCAGETRAALLENGVLQELFIERSDDLSYVGNIYCGKVLRVLPGMQAAFIDIGLERSGFLHINDINLSAINKPANTDISAVIYSGQTIFVQVMKDPLGSKGARLTTHYSLSSHYLVYMPDSSSVGISQRIDDELARASLSETVSQIISSEAVQGGVIVRTAAEGCSEQDIRNDMLLLVAQWRSVCDRRGGARVGDLLYRDLAMMQRVLRDSVHATLQRVLVDDDAACIALKSFATEYVPDVEPKIDLYDGKRPLFDLYSIEDEIEKALRRRVDLKSGGYIIFDQTEAMTTVDVNSGAFVGRRSLEETAYKTNLEAAVAIARQLRIRNLGGMIIIDFIDMQDEEHRQQLNAALDRALSDDRAKVSRHELQALGLAALTRKRTRESLEHVLCDDCPYCNGQGGMRSVVTVLNDLFRDISREIATHDKKQLVVVVSEEIGHCLYEEASVRVAQIEADLGVRVAIRVEPQYARDQFDVILL